MAETQNDSSYGFETGDIVQLKSGGPKMTVKGPSIVDGEVYWCQWFAGKKLESGEFHQDSLVKPEDYEDG